MEGGYAVGPAREARILRWCCRSHWRENTTPQRSQSRLESVPPIASEGGRRSRPVARFKLPFSAKKLESHDSQRVSTVAASEVVAVGTLACWIARWVGSVPTMIGGERSRSPSVSPTTSSSAPTTESHGASHGQASGRHSRSVTASPLPGQRRRTRRRSGRSDRRSTSGETTLAADQREEIEEIFSG